MSERLKRTRPAVSVEDAIDGLTPQAAQVLRQFRIVFNTVRNHFQQIERQSGLGGAQLWTLSLVAKRPGIGMGELADAMDVHQSTASNLIRLLVRKRLVRSSRDEGDRRAVNLFVTDEGVAVLATAPGPFAGVLPDALGRLDAETLDRLSDDLATLIDVLSVEEPETAARTPLAGLG
ncbi:MarR family transcriptional regulator [Aquabacterium fontiphilum]|jgi:DNA-binding MarR family transcriptional regulator|uniref:MarR family winged helix-turn-helix transcriptional regulator n=1 Tax=Aquabacterium fontiphilum TaxID=450365 RepID=UPI0013780E1D|nr:MarR family transcriptional regulator [Aquabacterium fontiphilum]NBD21328.1 MarR family transcriptional regulator [Aquabacterium fontiphilum]